MKLRTDSNARLDGRDVLKPNTDYQAETEGNRIVLVEVAAETAEVPTVALVPSKEGFLMFPPKVKISRKAIRAAIRADRDAQ